LNARSEPQLPAEQTLNRATLAVFREVDPSLDLIRTLIDQFLADAASQVHALRESARTGDEAFRATAHSLKGSAATMGAEKLAASCALLEYEPDAAARAALTAEIANEFTNVQRALAAERECVDEG